jgi:hypothetical protein
MPKQREWYLIFKDNNLDVSFKLNKIMTVDSTSHLEFRKIFGKKLS